MSDALQQQNQVAELEYEHRKANGVLASRGKTVWDRKGRVHSIQWDGKGRKIVECIYDPDGTLLETKLGDHSIKGLFIDMVESIKRLVRPC